MHDNLPRYILGRLNQSGCAMLLHPFHLMFTSEDTVFLMTTRIQTTVSKNQYVHSRLIALSDLPVFILLPRVKMPDW